MDLSPVYFLTRTGDHVRSTEATESRKARRCRYTGFYTEPSLLFLDNHGLSRLFWMQAQDLPVFGGRLVS